MSVETQAAVTQMKHFAFLLRSLAADIPVITGNATARTQVDDLTSDAALVPGNGMDTNVTKSEFESFMQTLDDFSAFLTPTRRASLNAILKGL